MRFFAKFNRFTIRCGAAMLVLLCWPEFAGAQVPFINPGVTAFDPEISVVNTGVLQDAQATVSADRKYVTITARPQNSQLLALSTFAFQSGTTTGIVGGATPGVAPAAAEGVVVNPPVMLGAGAGVVLSRRGLTRIISAAPVASPP